MLQRLRLLLTNAPRLPSRCRCSYYFCAAHRYTDKHACTFDYKSKGKAQIDDENPLVAFAKVEKF